MTDLVIENPSLQSQWQRLSSTLFTFIFWLLWFYLWIPILTFIAWVVSIDMVYLQMYKLGGLRDVANDLVFIISGVVALGGTLIIWASYNYIRFKGEDRRKASAPVNNDQLADAFDVDVTMLPHWQVSKALSIEFDGEGRIINVSDICLTVYQDDLIKDEFVIRPEDAGNDLITDVGKTAVADVS
jgi:biofilm PGA synthesis protein PgaD